MTPVTTYPSHVIEQPTGVRHRVVESWLDAKGHQLVRGACEQVVVLGGDPHPRPQPCAAEGDRG